MQRQRPLLPTLASLILLGLLVVLFPGKAAAESSTSHVVRPGDTLASIAALHGVTTGALVRANGLADPDMIRTGQRLIVPGVSSAPAAQQAGPTSAGTSSGSTYTVRPGQTLSQIADQLKLSASAIARLNGLTNPDLIWAGLVLRLPGAAGSAGSPAPAGIAPVSGGAGQGTRFVASISQQRCWLYVNGQLAGNWRCSTGRKGAPTVPGSYKIQSKINPAYASTWDFWMPYWLGIYYAGSVENGIHGLPYDPKTGRKTWEGLVGTPITYGCIMLDNENARKVYDVAYIGMPVIVTP